jgi:D-alanyl-D-alanine carboxypeptidase (penicillin-binding protein 5/6)
MTSLVFRSLARRRSVTIPGHAMLPTSNTLLATYAGLDGVKTGHTDEAGWNLAASAERDGVRLYAVVLGAPNEAIRDDDVARLLDWGFDRFGRATLLRAGQVFGRSGALAVVAATGISARLDPGEQVRERVVLPRRLNSPVRAGQQVGYVELRSTRGLLGRVPLVADRAGGGRPALVPWLRSLDLP